MSLSDQLQTLKENWLLVTGFVLLVLLVSGSPALTSIAGEAQYGDAATLDARSTGAKAESASDSRQVTTTSSFTVETRSIERQSREVTNITERYDALILNENQNRDNGELERVWYQITVPAANQSQLIDELQGLGAVQTYDVRVDDITERYQDTQEELEAAQEKLDRLNELYNESDNELRVDILDQLIDQEQRVRQLQRQLSYVQNRTARTTVYFTLVDHDLLTTSLIDLEQILNELVQSLNALVSWIIYLLPWAVIGSIGYYAYRRLN
jgi:uncharacterized protein YjgD (DUF1641 family)